MNTKITVGCMVLAGLAVALMAGCGSENNGGAKFRAYLQHFGGDDLVAAVEIRALDNQTGADLGISATTDATGWVTFDQELPADANGEVGFRSVGALVGAATYIDTYQFNIQADALDERLWVVDQPTYQGAPLMAGVTKQDGTPGLDPGTAVIAGGIYWVDANDPDEVENHIGCATAKTDPESGQVRYFGDNGLPTTIASRPDTNPLVAYYLVANATPGKVTVRAYMDQDEIGSTSLHTYADAVSISNIYADGTQPDPEPADCQ
jgi:hypothetical protein